MSDSDAKPLFKKRANRPQPRQRPSEDVAEEAQTPKDSREASEGAEEEKLSIEELIELRKLRRQKQGIDSTKLNAGIVKKKRKEEGEEERRRRRCGPEDDADIAKKIIKSNNFTQQTNKLECGQAHKRWKNVEENWEGILLRERVVRPIRRALPHIRKIQTRKEEEAEEGSVTNSAAMLAAIPEVDLGGHTAEEHRGDGKGKTDGIRAPTR
ncbi:hepatocellular carcinoma-associated antigen 59 [Ceratobasidium sp. AG-Ba]|nr:hepatocellular carcinoma-associated antigen 59 [Ceratobasidium sp. AG-Ba]